MLCPCYTVDVYPALVALILGPAGPKHVGVIFKIQF